MLRLDPIGRYSFAQLGSVTDFRKLWEGVDAVSKYQIPEPTILFSLTASRAEVEKQELGTNRRLEPFERPSKGRYDMFTQRSAPGEAIAQHPLMNRIAELIALSPE